MKHCARDLKKRGTDRLIRTSTACSIRTSLGQLYKDQIVEGIIKAGDVQFPTLLPGVSDLLYTKGREEQLAKEMAPVHNLPNARCAAVY